MCSCREKRFRHVNPTATKRFITLEQIPVAVIFIKKGERKAGSVNWWKGAIRVLPQHINCFLWRDVCGARGTRSSRTHISKYSHELFVTFLITSHSELRVQRSNDEVFVEFLHTGAIHLDSNLLDFCRNSSVLSDLETSTRASSMAVNPKRAWNIWVRTKIILSQPVLMQFFSRVVHLHTTNIVKKE